MQFPQTSIFSPSPVPPPLPRILVREAFSPVNMHDSRPSPFPASRGTGINPILTQERPISGVDRSNGISFFWRERERSKDFAPDAKGLLCPARPPPTSTSPAGAGLCFFKSGISPNAHGSESIKQRLLKVYTEKVTTTDICFDKQRFETATKKRCRHGR